MKKLVFTIAALTAFTVANAQTELQPSNQTPKKVSTDEKAGATTPKKTGAVVENGALSTTGTSTTSATEPKKSGTRMAINEKGLPGEKKPANTTKAATNSNPK
jgi:hypothetical protein